MDRENVVEIRESGITSLAFQPYNNHIVGSSEDGLIKVWNASSGIQVGSDMRAGGRVNAITFSKDGRWIVAGTQRGLSIVWDAITYLEVNRIKTGGVEGRGLDVSPDSKTFAAGSVGIWNISDGQELAHWSQGLGDVKALKFSPEGERIATATGWSSIRVFDSRSGNLLIEIPDSISSYPSLAWSSDGKQIFSFVEGRIVKYDAARGVLLSVLPGHGRSPGSFILIANNGKFLVHVADDSVSLWDTSTRAQLGYVIENIGRSIALSPDGRLLASFHPDKIVIRSLQNSLPESYFTKSFPAATWRDWLWERIKAESTANKEPQVLIDLLRNWVEGHSTSGSWKKLLGIANELKIPKFVVYQAVCEGLQVEGRLTEAIECSRALMSDDDAVRAVKDNAPNWILDFEQRCAQTFESRGDTSKKFQKIDEAAERYSAALSLRPERKTLAKWVETKLTIISWGDILGATRQFKVPKFAVYQAICEALEAGGRMTEAVECFNALANDPNKFPTVQNDDLKWMADFKPWYAEKFESRGDAYLESQKHHEAAAQYSAALSIHPQRKTLTKWAETKLMSTSWKKVLGAAAAFKVPKLAVYRVVCEVLEASGRVAEAAECFHTLASDRDGKTTAEYDGGKWLRDFGPWCAKKLETLGDVEMESHKYGNAVNMFSAALSFQPRTSLVLFIKRSKAHLLNKSWEHALRDSNEAIALDPAYPWAYGCKHDALHGSGRYDEAILAHKTMLSAISHSRNPKTRELQRKYIKPSKTETVILKVVQSTIRDLPRVLIDVATGRLQDKTRLALSFEGTSTYKELISSMTTHIDRPRIEKAVADYFRYAMLSHKWDGIEPSFQVVENVSIYDLEQSLTNDKLRRFCLIVRKIRIKWAWSDTCCIDKKDHVVLQESLVSMFKWYCRSALTVVYLRGVKSPSKHGDLANSIWNTRGWTYQEYVAAEVIQFYAEDWRPYLNLPLFNHNSDILNHKAAPDIAAEMEQVFRFDIGDWDCPELRPGLDNIRLKLCLASTRYTTRVEDTAYSLFGILSTSVPVLYGEGESALGRLLAQVLTSSGDATILAWTGESSSYNSCMPARISVFQELPTSHLPSTLETTDTGMDRIVADLRASSPDATLSVSLYDRLSDLGAPWFKAARVKLPCITFQLGPPRIFRMGGIRVYRAMTIALGVVEIRTTEELPKHSPLYLVHPWINALLDRALPNSSAWIGEELGLPPLNPDEEEIADEESEAPPSPLETSSLILCGAPRMMDREMRALRMIARIRQPFGALLLAHRADGVEYTRVATDCLITVRVQENTPIAQLIDNIRTLDVL